MSKTTEVIPLQKVKRAMEKMVFQGARELKDTRKYYNEQDLEFNEVDCFEYGLIRGIEMLATELDIKINTSKINY